MLQLTVALGPDGWDEEKEEFVTPKYMTLTLEHSLVSLSKWESKWHKPFLVKTEKSTEEVLDYIKCMTLTQNVPPEAYQFLTRENIVAVTDYINNPMTATTFREEKGGKPNREIITAELIYYWMIAQGIPSEYQKWHLNRLLTLVRVCNVKNKPSKKMSKRDIYSRNAALNASQKQLFNTSG